MTTTKDTAAARQPARYPRATIRLRYGRKTLTHGLALGWRTEWEGEPFPVEVRRIGEDAPNTRETLASTSRAAHEDITSTPRTAA